MKIREAKKEDKKAIRDLIRMMGPKKLFQTHLPTYKSFFVAEKGGVVVGCCALQIYSKRMCEVRSLAVHPDHRGDGLGLKLINACKARAIERGIIEICTVTSEKKLFEAAGFGTLHKEKLAMLIVLADTA